MFPGVNHSILSYIIGLDSLKTTTVNDDPLSWRVSNDIRLRMDGLFEKKDHAVQFTKEFIALYTNGPAGGGGIRSFSCQLLLPLVFLKCWSMLLAAYSISGCLIPNNILPCLYCFSLVICSKSLF